MRKVLVTIVMFMVILSGCSKTAVSEKNVEKPEVKFDEQKFIKDVIENYNTGSFDINAVSEYIIFHSGRNPSPEITGALEDGVVKASALAVEGEASGNGHSSVEKDFDFNVTEKYDIVERRSDSTVNIGVYGFEYLLTLPNNFDSSEIKYAEIDGELSSVSLTVLVTSEKIDPKDYIYSDGLQEYFSLAVNFEFIVLKKDSTIKTVNASAIASDLEYTINDNTINDLKTVNSEVYTNALLEQNNLNANGLLMAQFYTNTVTLSAK